jgi:protein-S-isoprenylcysteine O-methyltransferase Ste14
MEMNATPIGALFFGIIFFVMVSIELGYRVGGIVHKRTEEEKESAVSAIEGAVLGLFAFILAFTFGMVAERYDARKGLVREEANVIRTACMRSDFLPEPDRAEARRLLLEYVDARLGTSHFTKPSQVTPEQMQRLLADSDRIQRRLWDMAVTNARKDMNSDVAALYIESLNQLSEVHASRVAIGLQQRIPGSIWIVLWSLTFLGMAGVGYQTAIAGSKRSWARPILAISFSLVITLIAALDRPQNDYVRVSQQPMIDVRDFMRISSGNSGDLGDRADEPQGDRSEP